jgi:hypothetical protein
MTASQSPLWEAQKKCHVSKILVESCLPKIAGIIALCYDYWNFGLAIDFRAERSMWKEIEIQDSEKAIHNPYTHEAATSTPNTALSVYCNYGSAVCLCHCELPEVRSQDWLLLNSTWLMVVLSLWCSQHALVFSEETEQFYYLATRLIRQPNRNLNSCQYHCKVQSGRAEEPIFERGAPCVTS